MHERALDANCSPTERALLRQRVKLVEPRLIYYHEVPIQSVFSIDVLFDQMNELSQPWPTFAYVLDLRDAQKPPTEVRRHLKYRVELVQKRVVRVSTLVGSNVMMAAMAHIWGLAMGLPISVHTNVEDALARARRDLGSLG